MTDTTAITTTALDAGRKAISTYRLAFEDGLDWDDLGPLSTDTMAAITAITKLAIDGGMTKPDAANLAGAVVWPMLVDEYWDSIWSELTTRLPFILRWVPGLGGFLKSMAKRKGPKLVDAAIRLAKQAAGMLAR